MMYAVVPFQGTPNDFLERIKAIDSNAYISQDPRVFFVQSSGNSRYVADRVGFTDTGSYTGMVGIVIPIQGDYAGFATNDLWDYLSVVK